MSENYFENELHIELFGAIDRGDIRIEKSSAPYFDALNRLYPADGSKIAWKQLIDSAERHELGSEFQSSAFAGFFADMVERKSLDGEVVYVGDSATEFALVGDVKEFLKCLAPIFSIPQHHFFISKDLHWCMAFFMEGDMGFGRTKSLGSE